MISRSCSTKIRSQTLSDPWVERKNNFPTSVTGLYKEHIPQDITFLYGMTFHTQSKNRGEIKRDKGRYILNDLNLNMKRRENLKATHPTIF